MNASSSALSTAVFPQLQASTTLGLLYEASPPYPPAGLRDGKNTPRGRVEFQFRHNVCGRRMYADGTADAVEFIANKAMASAEKRVYNMVDILKEGGI